MEARDPNIFGARRKIWG